MRLIYATLILLGLTACDGSGNGSPVDCRSKPEQRPYFQETQGDQSMEATLENIVKCFPSEDNARGQAENIGANAPKDIQDVLTQLYLNSMPDKEMLQALGQDKLNLLLRPKDDKFTHSTLLTEAVRQANYRWTIALLEAGADPNGSGSLMAYVAAEDIFDPRSKWTHLFKDGAPAIPFLEAYLKHGGKLNTTAEGGYGTTPLINAPFNNLAAFIYLLEQGADPWLSAKEPKERRFGLTMFGTYIAGSRASNANEKIYAIVKRGLYQSPPQPLYQPMVHDKYLASLEDLYDATGSERRHKLWTLQKVIHAMIQAGAFEPSARMSELLAANPVPDSEGGWVMPEGQLHQDYDDPRVGAVLGTEIW